MEVEYSVKLNVPDSAVPPVAVTVALSFGSQFCADVMLVESCTAKHSLCRASLDPV